MGLRAHHSVRSGPLSSSRASAIGTDGWTAPQGNAPRVSPTMPAPDFWRSPRLRAAGFQRVYSRNDLDREQFGHAQEVIRARDHLRPELRASHATVARLPQAPDRFAPAEHLFDQLPLALTFRVPGMPSRAAVHVRAAMRSNVLRDMGCHAALAEFVDERCPIVRLVPGHGCDRHPGFLLRMSRASGSVVDACVWLVRSSPRKLTVGLPGSSGGGRSPGASSRGRKLLSEAHASIKVPSTVKCSVEISRAVFARSTIPARKWRATSASSNLLANVEASKIGSCIPRPRKKRNRRL